MTTRIQTAAARDALRAERVRRDREAARDAFIGRKAEIDAMLARLQALSDDHFNRNPDEINWGHVGEISDNAALLKRITDGAFREGDCA